MYNSPVSTAIALSNSQFTTIANTITRKPVKHRRNRDPRIAQFITAYIISGNGRKSALSVGCSERSAASQANKWLKRSDVSAELADLLSQRSNRASEPVEYVLGKLRAIADKADARDADRIAAAVALGKHYNMFTDRKEVDQRITITVERVGG